MGNTPTATTYIPPLGNKKWKAYCVLDVGAVTCGYAYSYENIKDFWYNKNWAESQGYISMRVPSAILYNTDRKPALFGFEAIDSYLSMSRDESQKVTFSYSGIMSFAHSSMTDNEATIDVISDDNDESSTESGDECLNIDTIGHTTVGLDRIAAGRTDRKTDILTRKADLAYLLAAHCKKEIENKYKTYKKSPDEFLWVFIVPYTWSIMEKHKFRLIMKKKFMQDFKNIFRIDIVSTTESLWLTVKGHLSHKNTPMALLKEVKSHSKVKGVILVNAGATRVETSLLVKHSAQTITQALCQNMGGRSINKMFEEHLKATIGEYGQMFVSECQLRYLSTWLEFMLQFEVARKKARFTDTKDIQMDVSFGFAEAFRNITQKHLKDCLRPGDIDSKLCLTSGGKLLIRKKLIGSMFMAVVHPIWCDIEKILNDNKTVDISGILLTGGFGESAFVREYLQNMMTFQNANIPLITPELANMLVTRGAIEKAKAKHHSERVYAVTYYAKPSNESVIGIEKKEGLHEDKVIEKMFPIICTDYKIKAGKLFKFGPFDVSVYTDQVSMNIYEISESSIRDTGIPKIKMVNNETFYLIKGFDNKVHLGTVSVDVPRELRGKHLNAQVIVTLDTYKFMVKMKVTSPMYSVSLSSKVECPYANYNLKGSRAPEPPLQDYKALQESRLLKSVFKETAF